MAARARIVLLAADGRDNREIAERVNRSENTVGLWRRRFSKEGPKGLQDAARCGAPSPFSAEQKTRVIQKALEAPRDNGLPFTHWSSASLAQLARDAGIVRSIHPSTVWKWLNDADLQPHRSRYWLKITDPEFESRMKDVTDLYLSAPELAKAGVPVFCVDEKTGLQALQRQTPDTLMRPKKPHRRDHRYVRRGATCLIGAFQVATGKVWGRFTPDHTGPTFTAFLREVCLSVAAAPAIHFVVDQFSAHSTLEVCEMVAELSAIPFTPKLLRTGDQRRAFLGDPTKRIVIHFTPVRASWLDQIEIWFSTLGKKVLHRGSFVSILDLQERVVAFIDHHNRFLARPYRWTYTGTPCRK